MTLLHPASRAADKAQSYPKVSVCEDQSKNKHKGKNVKSDKLNSFKNQAVHAGIFRPFMSLSAQRCFHEIHKIQGVLGD